MHPRRIAFRYLCLSFGSVVAICLSAGKLNAQVKKDTLFFYNGSMIAGELLSMRLGRIEFDADDIGVIKVKHTKLLGLTGTKHIYRLETIDREVFQSLLYRSSLPGAVRVLKDGGLLDLNIQDISSMYYFGKQFRNRFYTKVTGGYSFTNSSDIGRLNASTVVEYNSRNSLVKLTGDLIYTSDSSVFSRDRENVSLGYTHYLDGPFSWGGALAYQRNLELGLLRRWQEVLGAGYTVLRSRKQQGVLVAGLAVNQELDLERNESFNQEVIAQASYSLFSFSKPNLSLTINETGYYSLNQAGRYRLDGDLTISWEIVNNFNLEIEFYHNFDAKSPATGASRTDYGYVFGVAYEFPNSR